MPPTAGTNRRQPRRRQPRAAVTPHVPFKPTKRRPLPNVQRKTDGQTTIGTEIATSSHKLSRQEHANRINGAWRKTVEGIFETSAFLIAAENELSTKEFGAMLEEDLLMERSVATKIKLIGGKKALCAHVHKLPGRWGTLYELSKVKDDVLLAAIEDGTIHPKMERKEAETLRKPPPPSSPRGCPICTDTAQVPAGHQWSDDDDIEGQSSTEGFVDDLISEVQGIFGGKRQKRPTLRQKIEHVRNARVHPSIRAALAHALDEHAAIAKRLARELRSSLIDHDDEPVS
jgi:hypothetical protein